MNDLPVHFRRLGMRLQARLRVLGVIRTLVFVTLAGVLIAPTGTAMGTIGWCKSDPVVQIGPNIVDILLTAPADAPFKVTGPNEIVIVIPEGVSALPISLVGFGRGEVVSVEHSRKLKVTDQGIEVVVRAYVPATDDAMPVGLEFAPNILGLLRPATAQGVANSWITLKNVL